VLSIDSLSETIVSFWQLTSAFFFDKLARSLPLGRKALDGQNLASFLHNRLSALQQRETRPQLINWENSDATSRAGRR
jgi:hypothetical protein